MEKRTPYSLLEFQPTTIQEKGRNGRIFDSVLKLTGVEVGKRYPFGVRKGFKLPDSPVRASLELNAFPDADEDSRMSLEDEIGGIPLPESFHGKKLILISINIYANSGAKTRTSKHGNLPTLVSTPDGSRYFVGNYFVIDDSRQAAKIELIAEDQTPEDEMPFSSSPTPISFNISPKDSRIVPMSDEDRSTIEKALTMVR